MVRFKIIVLRVHLRFSEIMILTMVEVRALYNNHAKSSFYGKIVRLTFHVEHATPWPT